MEDLRPHDSSVWCGLCTVRDDVVEGLAFDVWDHGVGGRVPHRQDQERSFVRRSLEDGIKKIHWAGRVS